MKEPDPTEPVATLAALRSIAERAPVGVFRTDASGRWLYANAACLSIFGLTSGEASLGFGWLQAVHPDDVDTVRRRCLVEASGSGFLMQHRVSRPDGSVRAVMTRLWSLAEPGEPGEHGNNGGFVGSVTDVTDNVGVQSRLSETLELLDHTGRLSGVGGWVIDVERETVRWSDQTCRLHEVPLGHVPSVDEGIRYWAPQAQPVVRDIVERMLRLGEPCDFELPMVTARGREIWVRVVGEAEWRDGRVVRLFGASQDTTAQRLAAEELRRSREQLRLLYEETPALMASVDAAGRVLSTSRLLLDRLGLQRDAVVGASAASLLAGDAAERQGVVARVVARMRGPDGIRPLPLRLAHHDGSVVHTLMSAVVERDKAGRTVRMLAVFEDISEHIRSQAELARERALREELQRQARALAQLADERREMLDVLAHEVRQPLNNASAALQSAASLGGTQREPDALQRLARAQGVIGDVIAQIDNTLAAAALLVGERPLERADTDIDMLLQLVAADFAPADRGRIHVARGTPTRTASMDLSLMRLALRNLLANALRHAPPGTAVTLRVADSDEPLALLLDVEDQGPGVPESLRPRLFERGARGPASRGQGLGLHIARRALQLHGGTAELVSSRPGATVFRLVLVQDGGD